MISILVLFFGSEANANKLADMALVAVPPAQTHLAVSGATWRPSADDNLFPIDATNFWVLSNGQQMVTIDMHWLGRLGRTNQGAVRFVEVGDQSQDVRTFAITFDMDRHTEGWANTEGRFDGEIWRGDAWLPGLDWEPADPYAMQHSVATITLSRGVGPVALTATDGTVFSLKYAVVGGKPYR